MQEKKIISPTSPDLELCPVEGGEFLMGDDAGEYDDEKPARPVRVSGFYMGKFPVTQRLWQEVMGSNPSRDKGERQPVEKVSWGDAQVFLDKLNAREDVQSFTKELNPLGTKFRLPTEAEWEYAARGGQCSQGYTYAGSNQLELVGWHGNNKTQEVGQLLANELGIHDMSGNVFEWCQDWFGNAYYAECKKNGISKDPQGPATGTLRVLRGGRCFYDPLPCRSVNRYGNQPGLRYGDIGFRLVLPFQSAGS